MQRLSANILKTALLLSALTGALVDAAEPSAAGLDFFEKRIRPVLADLCYKCHSVGADKVKGGLLLDTRAGLLKGGDTGPAIVPGNVADHKPFNVCC